MVVHIHYSIRRHREPHALVAVRLREDRRVDPDHLTRHVQQRAAGVARVDRRVCLDIVQELPSLPLLDGPIFGRDNPCRHRLR